MNTNHVVVFQWPGTHLSQLKHTTASAFLGHVIRHIFGLCLLVAYAENVTLQSTNVLRVLYGL